MGVYDYIMLISFILAGVLLAVTVGLFFGLHIVQVWKELNGSMAMNLNGSLAQRQMAEIRLQNNALGKKKHNVFEEVENWTGEMMPGKGDASQMATTALGQGKSQAETTMLRPTYAATTMLGRGKSSHGDFVIEKDIVYVATERCL